MLAYLFYDRKDIDKNRSFIQWMIDEAKALSVDLVLYNDLQKLESLELPSFVINRSRVKTISRYFEIRKIPVFNTYEVTAITNDKYETYKVFRDHITMLHTTLYEEPTSYPCIVKKRHGHGGTDVHLISTCKDLHTNFDHTYIKQALAPQVGKDLRVYVVGNKIVEAILRHNPNDFKSNYTLGANISIYNLRQSEIAIVEKITSIMSLDYAGIDFLFDENNALILNEIEDAVGARMLCELTSHNIVKLYLDHILNKLELH